MKKLKKIDFEIWIEIWKNWNMSRKFEMKNWNFSFFNVEFSIFEIWNENFCLNFLKIGHITKWKWKKFEMKKSYISFMPLR
jgi:hypothetical protein